MTLSTQRAGGLLQRAALLFALLLTIGWSATAQAATITVNTNDDERNNDGDCALREAIIAANTDTVVDGCVAGSGADDIVFGPTVLVPMVTLGQAGFEVTSPMTIDGSTTTGRVTIDGSWLYRIFDVRGEGDLQLSDFDLIRGIAEVGGAVLVRASATFSASSVGFDANRATGDAATDGGGAIYAMGAIGGLTDVSFTNNEATGTSGSGGALFVNGVDAVIDGATFTSNTANRAGGAIESRDGSLTLTDVDFTTNDAGANPGNGGAIHLTGSASADITGGTVAGNRALEGGGFWNSTAEMRVTGTTFTGNVASGDGSADRIKGGGALFNNGGLVVVTDVTATGNSATGVSGSGGAFLNGSGGAFWVMTSTVSNNLARRAGGGFEDAGGTAVLVMSVFNGNSIVDGANPGNGGAVHSGGGTVVVAGGTFSGNAAVEGGGLWTSGTMVITADEADLPDPMVPNVVIPTITVATISENEATGNDADQGGGGLYATPSGVIQIFEARVIQNVASGTAGSGGGIFSAGDLLAEGTEITGNQANRAGGGIEDAGGTVRLTDVTLSNNVIGTAAPGNGGGLHSGGGTVTILRSTIVGNTAVEGGGLWSNGTLTINGGADGDREEDEGAAQGDRSFFTSIAGNEATGNDAGIGGGGIYVETGGEASIRYAVLNNNVASGTSGSGGGLFVADGASATASFTEVTNNAANRAGGGIELFDDAATPEATRVSLRQVLVRANVIDTPAPGNGGGLHAGGAAMVDALMSTFAGNTATEGGGLWINSAGSLSLGNATVSGNAAQNDGGGIYDNGGASIDLASVTVASNTAGMNGGGIVSESDASFSLQNTIVSNNEAAAGADCFGTFQSGDYNMVQAIEGCTLLGGDPITNIIGADPVLADLAYNGGFTPTRGLMIWSRAIDTGSSTFDVDQRGRLRTFTADDRGAFEFEGADVATGDEPDASTFRLGAPQPNPATSRTRVTFSATTAEPVELALFNVLGQRVQTVFSGPASAEQSVELDVRGLASGVYILRLSGAAGMETRQITVTR